MDNCIYCGSEMIYYDGGDPKHSPETWSCTGCAHVCYINEDTGEIDCECQSGNVQTLNFNVTI